MQNNEAHIKEYESYLKTVLNSGFDYQTWHEHQYGKSPELKVETNLKINVVESQETTK